MKTITAALLIAISTVGLSAMTKISQSPVNFKEPVIHTHDGGDEPPLPIEGQSKPPR